MAEAHAVKLDAKEPKAILLKEIAKVESTPQLTTAPIQSLWAVSVRRVL